MTYMVFTSFNPRLLLTLSGFIKILYIIFEALMAIEAPFIHLKLTSFKISYYNSLVQQGLAYRLKARLNALSPLNIIIKTKSNFGP